jgi:hypothetical protein
MVRRRSCSALADGFEDVGEEGQERVVKGRSNLMRFEGVKGSVGCDGVEGAVEGAGTTGIGIHSRSLCARQQAIGRDSVEVRSLCGRFPVD